MYAQKHTRVRAGACFASGATSGFNEVKRVTVTSIRGVNGCVFNYPVCVRVCVFVRVCACLLSEIVFVRNLSVFSLV